MSRSAELLRGRSAVELRIVGALLPHSPHQEEEKSFGWACLLVDRMKTRHATVWETLLGHATPEAAAGMIVSLNTPMGAP